mgnify:CR=1 FL=1
MYFCRYGEIGKRTRLKIVRETLWVRVPLAAIMDCTAASKNINSFIKGTLKGNELRHTYFHLKKCDKCREVLLDEFSFYTIFNDLDKNLDFNYKKSLEKLMHVAERKIIEHDEKLRKKYFIMSIAICILFFVLLVIALRVVYR